MKIKLKQFTYGLAGLILFVTMFSESVTVFADINAENNRYNVMFVLDASGSMNDTDPGGLRFEAVTQFANLLAEHGNYLGGIVFSTAISAQQEPVAVDSQQDRENEVYPIVYACIDEPQKLRILYGKHKDTYHCVYQKDIYTNEQWLEIMPKAASKSNAITQLKKLLGCDKLVVFGDGKNDIDMFEIADECYAVKNAHEEWKRKSTAIIESNDDDGVAKWLIQNSL